MTLKENITKQFQKSVEKYRDDVLKLDSLRDEQTEVVRRFKSSSPAGKEKLKKELISLHRKVEQQKKVVDQSEREFNKVLLNEPTDFEIEETISESFTSTIINNIKKSVESAKKQSLLSIQKSLIENGYSPTMVYSPFPHLLLKRGRSKFVITLRSHVTDDSEFVVGKYAGGILENTTLDEFIF